MRFAHEDGVDVPAQRSWPDEPVPRWSRTTRSRPASAGAMSASSLEANGIAAWPGPPARPMTALSDGLLGATLRLTLRVIVPAALPLGSSGTASCPHWKPAGVHGANAIAASALGVVIAPAATRAARPARVERTRIGPPTVACAPTTSVTFVRPPRKGLPRVAPPARHRARRPQARRPVQPRGPLRRPALLL